jgi:putative endonuclease
MDDRLRKQAGSTAEDNALSHLRQQGLKLIARNYRCRAGEIDLVMLDGSTLVLIEVRYRATTAFGGAAASVTPHKQRRLALAAKHLLVSRAELRRYPARFDVVAVAPAPGGDRQIEWIRNAFIL